MMTESVDYCKNCYHRKEAHYQLHKAGACGEVDCSCPEFAFGETRTTAASGAQKGVKEERFSLVPVYPLTLLSRLYAFGAKKYAAHNWRKGYEWSKSYDSVVRHLTQFWEGEDIDPETGIPHVICAAFHCFVLAQYMKDHPELDDRYKPSDGIDELVEAVDNLNKSEIITKDETYELLGVKPTSLKEFAAKFDPGPLDWSEPPMDVSKDYVQSFPPNIVDRISRAEAKGHAIQRAAEWLSTHPRGSNFTYDDGYFTSDDVDRIYRLAEVMRGVNGFSAQIEADPSLKKTEEQRREELLKLKKVEEETPKTTPLWHQLEELAAEYLKSEFGDNRDKARHLLAVARDLKSNDDPVQ